MVTASTITSDRISFRSVTEDETWLHRRLSRGAPSILIGPTGCGKTTLVHQVGRALDRQVITVIGSGHLTLGDLLGRWHLAAEGSVWHEGPLTRAAREGAIFYLDEIEGCTEDILVTLNPLLDHRRTLYLSARNETIAAAPGFAFVASYNPGYSRVRDPLSPAFRQRCGFRVLDYLPEHDEVELIIDATGLQREMAERLVIAGRATRNKSVGIIEGASTRLLLAAAQELLAGVDFNEVLESTIVFPLTDDQTLHASILQSVKTMLSITFGSFDADDEKLNGKDSYGARYDELDDDSDDDDDDSDSDDDSDDDDEDSDSDDDSDDEDEASDSDDDSDDDEDSDSDEEDWAPDADDGADDDESQHENDSDESNDSQPEGG